MDDFGVNGMTLYEDIEAFLQQFDGNGNGGEQGALTAGGE